MQIEEIKTIVKMMKEYELTEFKIEADGCNLSISRLAGAAAPAPAAVPETPAAAPAAVPEVPAAPAPAEEPPGQIGRAHV